MRPVKILTLVIALTTFFLMLLGGVVHTQGASLACPDWPLCYGEVLPPTQAGPGGWLEQGHRFVATGVGLMVLALVALTARGPARRYFPAALVGLAAVSVQGLWGALTVVLRLPTWASVAHLGPAMLVLAWAVTLGVRVWVPAPATEPAELPPRAPVALAAGAVYLQMVLGALVRHTQASLACGDDLVTCAGHLWPDTALQALHLTHRYGAVVVGLVAVAGTVPVMGWARRTGQPLVRRLGLAAHLLVLAQWGIGLWVVRSHVHLHVVTLHLGLAALLWSALVAAWTATGRRPASVLGPSAGAIGMPAMAGGPRGAG